MPEKQTFLKQNTLKEIPESQRGQVLAALEAFVGPDTEARAHGLEILMSLDAHRRSPMVAAIMASYTDEPDIGLRSTIVEALADVLRSDSDEARPPDRVRHWMRHILSQMRQREIYALLQILDLSPERIESVCCILDACSFSGEALVRILANRKADVSIRIAAAKAIGRIGFLDAGPTLRRMQERLLSRKAGQLEMAFATISDEEAERLLPAILDALHSLEGGVG
jgi:hypothetical protein